MTSIAVLSTPNMKLKLAMAPRAMSAPKTAVAKLNLVEPEANIDLFGDSVGNGLGVPADGAAGSPDSDGAFIAIVSTAVLTWLAC